MADWSLIGLIVLAALAVVGFLSIMDVAVLLRKGGEVKIVVYQDGAGEWRWRAVARNGRVVADSGEDYASARNAERAAQTVKDGMATAVIERKGG